MTLTNTDRPAAIRRALRDLVSERGFHGTSMSAVAQTAGVATGTAYVHYESKEELVYATYLEIKRELGEAVLDATDIDARPRERFAQIWKATYRHLMAEPERARFIVQLEVSPFHHAAHERLLQVGDPLSEQAARPDLVKLLVPLPLEVLAALSIGLIARLVATGVTLSAGELETIINSSWKAITA